MPKHEKVPETKDTKPNREQRRHPEKFERPENEPISRADDVQEPAATDPAVTGSGHRKPTADKWNQ